MPMKKSGARTLLLSIIMSSPGPIVVGLSLITGHSSTQVADFVRRTSEFFAIVVSYFVYIMIHKNGECDTLRKRRLEHRSNLFVGGVMCFAGIIMAVIAIAVSDEGKGNVIPGLVIALISLVGNSFFLIKYTRLSKAMSSTIMTVQMRLYRAKTLVDTSVAVALTAVIVNPDGTLVFWLDIVGSMVVSIYLFWNGVKTVYREMRPKNKVLRED